MTRTKKEHMFVDEWRMAFGVWAMKAVGYLALFVAGVVVGYLMSALGVVDAVDGLSGNQTEPDISLPTYLSFLSVMMTAVTVVLASLAIGIGVVAAYTFRDMKEEAKKAAAIAIKDALSDEAISNRINEVAFGKRQTPTVAELEEGFDPDDDGNR